MRRDQEMTTIPDRAILDAMMSAFEGSVYICSPDYRVQAYNETMRNRIGRDVVGELCYLALHDRDSVCPWCPNERVFAGETMRSIAQSPKDGRWFQVCSAPIWNDGVVVAKLGTFVDISERKRSEEEILSLNATLDRRVKERTAELESAIREQESFSYCVSHDLRAPLRHINCFSSIVMEEFASQVPDEARHYLERIRDASTKMGTLIDSLLNLSQVARTEITKEKVDLSTIAAAIAASFVEAEPGRKVAFSVEEGLTVRGDRNLLGQMLEKLLENAWKYSSARETARIEVGRTSSAGADTFFVKDNGAGFDMAHSEKLFSIFHRMHGNEFEGTGIGLAIAQRIVHRHGGTIWAEARLDEGATFYFTLP